ncbi:uncharacterized protein ACR2FA_004853 [Aphomia sociella]
MDYHGRRNRRGRGGYSRTNPTSIHAFISPQSSKSWPFLSGLYNFFIMTSLIAIIYLMLEYHCSTCNKKYNLNNINNSIDDISKNLSLIKNSYDDLETQIFKFSQDLPKIEGQIEILEALARTIDRSNLVWDPKLQLSLQNVDVRRYNNKSTKQEAKNIRKINSTHCKLPKAEGD